jgi:dipeptidyl aminopeptidase/acylaminoacyl peptidase
VPSTSPPVSADQLFRATLEPGLGRVSAATDLSCSPDGKALLMTGDVRFNLESQPATKVFVFDPELAALTPLTSHEGCSELCARWSPDGKRIAWLSDQGSSGLFGPWVMDVGDPASARRLELPHLSAEAVHWCQDSARLLVLAAEEGAEQGVASGSGAVTSRDGQEKRPPWEPTVHRGDATLGGWRMALVLDTGSAEHRRISETGLNVWEVALAGDALVAVVSSRPFEGDWTKAWLELIALDGSWHHPVHRPRAQLGKPCSSPDGSILAVIEGLASDRGLVAGDVVVLDRSGGDARHLDLNGVDATSLQFRDRDRLVVSGVRDLETVVLEYDLKGGGLEIHHQGMLTSSNSLYPEAEPHPAGGALLCAESWAEPAHLVHVRAGHISELASLADPGQLWLKEQLGSMEALSWTSSDGLRISGFFAAPRLGNPPYPTILVVHGGPAHCWRSSWPVPNQMLAAALSARGYALLLPNPRGSSGRGQDFLAMEIGDYGGGEVDDHLSGLDLLVSRGLADPDRLGVYGVSHGGYMSCWLTTQTTRFRAAVAGSPVTDWYSQHFSSNIADFDEMYLQGSPLDEGGAYYQRSPVFFAHRSRTPTLLAAGMVDRCTPPGQAVEFHQALLAAGVETDLVLYPQEGHGVRSIPARIDMADRALAFFDRHLGPPKSK